MRVGLQHGLQAVLPPRLQMTDGRMRMSNWVKTLGERGVVNRQSRVCAFLPAFIMLLIFCHPLPSPSRSSNSSPVHLGWHIVSCYIALLSYSHQARLRCPKTKRSPHLDNQSQSPFTVTNSYFSFDLSPPNHRTRYRWQIDVPTPVPLSSMGAQSAVTGEVSSSLAY